MKTSLASYRNHSILLFVILLVAYSYILPRWADWSQNSRIDLTRAIVEQGSLRIDDYYENTGDYALYEGHYYSDKAPGPAFLAVPIYALTRPILQSEPVQGIMTRIANSEAFGDTLNEEGSGLLTDKIYAAAVLYIATIFVSALPSAILGVLLFWFLMDLGISPGWSAVVVLIYGLATNAFAYAGAFFGHQLVAFLLFSAFYIAFKIKREELGGRWVIVAGLALGYALISEYPSFLIAVAVFVYTLWVLYRRYQSAAWGWMALLILAGLPPGLLLMAYDMAIYATPLPVGYTYSALYQDLHSTGFLSLTYPHPDAIWGITFSPRRGLFFIAPVLLLAVVGLFQWWRGGKFRTEAVVCTWAFLSFMLFNGSSVMWEGGFAIGPRYVVPMLPFLAAGLGIFLQQRGKDLLARVLLVLLTAWSVFVVWAQTVGGQNYPDWSQNPLLDYSLPYISQGDVARNLGMILGLRGIASLLPLVLVLVVLMVILQRLLVNRAENAEPQTFPAPTAEARS